MDWEEIKASRERIIIKKRYFSRSQFIFIFFLHFLIFHNFAISSSIENVFACWIFNDFHVNCMNILCKFLRSIFFFFRCLCVWWRWKRHTANRKKRTEKKKEEKKREVWVNVCSFKQNVGHLWKCDLQAAHSITENKFTEIKKTEEKKKYYRVV